MWEIYDALIETTPPDVLVSEALLGLRWTLVRSATTGMAMTPHEGRLGTCQSGPIAGQPVRRLAEQIKSWNLIDANLAVAAINSVLNTVEQVETLTHQPIGKQKRASAFDYFKEKVRGKKVAVVGHFPGLKPLADVCQISILERRPQEGDYPDPACEYILPEQDCVFLTGTTLANKTLPRLLQLSQGAFTVLVGPSTPLNPVLFDFGVDVLAGMVVTQPEAVWQTVQEGGCFEIFERGGQMVNVSAKDG